MKNRHIKLVVLLGFFAIGGIVIIQMKWLSEALNFEEHKFHEKVHIALLEVVANLYAKQDQPLPVNNPVNQKTNDYYIVEINNEFDAATLEYYIKSSFNKFRVYTDFEYAIYDCHTDRMVYGNYVSSSTNQPESKSPFFPKSDELVYYFAVHFPDKETYYFASMKSWLILSAVLLIVLIIYVYSLFVILQQKRFSELQKDFINNMTHEFKTPLSSILLAASHLKYMNDERADHTDKKNTYLHLITKEANRLNEHIEQILTPAKTENRLFTLKKHKIDALKIIHLVSEEFRLTHPHIQLEIVHNRSNHTILADEDHFSHLISNLIDNAIKYSRVDPCIQILLCRTSSALELHIIDHGIGIPISHQKKIFQKFYRVPDQISPNRRGFGLGLFYVKNICKRHGWSIHLKSEVNEGTQIIISVPNQ